MEKPQRSLGPLQSAGPRSFRLRTLSNTLSVWTVAACALGVAASSAHASCGDWLAHSDNSMRASNARATSPVQNTATLGTKFGNSARLPLTAPCRGSHCSKSPASPTQPSPPLGSEARFDRLALVTHGSAYDPPERHFCHGCEVGVHSSKGFLPRIDHPPRA